LEGLGHVNRSDIGPLLLRDGAAISANPNNPTDRHVLGPSSGQKGNGRVLHDNLRQELMTKSQLDSKLRRQGVSSLTEVTKAVMEGDGQVTVIKKAASPLPTKWPDCPESCWAISGSRFWPGV
jgi:uncharacterized protein DUF421